jgi:hypothetical protein
MYQMWCFCPRTALSAVLLWVWCKIHLSGHGLWFVWVNVLQQTFHNSNVLNQRSCNWQTFPYKIAYQHDLSIIPKQLNIKTQFSITRHRKTDIITQLCQHTTQLVCITTCMHTHTSFMLQRVGFPSRQAFRLGSYGLKHHVVDVWMYTFRGTS